MLTTAFEDLWQVRDRRVDSWPLMDSPWPILGLCSAYVLLSKIGPLLMRPLPPMQLFWPLVGYNAVQVVMALYMFVGFLAAGWATHYQWVCQPVDYSEEGLPMLRLGFVYFLTRVSHFADTFFLIVRKKRVTKLQIVHHTSMPLITWIVARWVGGGHVCFVPLTNTAVHVLVYGHFLASALVKDVAQNKLWKKVITSMEIAQIFASIVHCVAAFLVPDCAFPKLPILLVLGLGSALLALFVQFYNNSYHVVDQSHNKQHSFKLKFG